MINLPSQPTFYSLQGREEDGFIRDEDRHLPASQRVDSLQILLPATNRSTQRDRETEREVGKSLLLGACLSVRGCVSVCAFFACVCPWVCGAALAVATLPDPRASWVGGIRSG